MNTLTYATRASSIKRVVHRNIKEDLVIESHEKCKEVINSLRTEIDSLYKIIK
jgi:hypothetical protein